MSRIDWPALKFPPINLWVIAALPQKEPIARKKHRHVKPEGAQWLQNRQQQIKHLLATR